LLLFSERGEAGGAEGAVYLRKTDGSPAVKLGAGTGVALSPDGKWAMTISRSLLDMHLLPTGAGTPVRMKGTFARYESGGWLPDGKQIVLTAMEAQHDPRIYVQDLSGDPRAISPEGLISGALVSPDGGHIAAVISGKAYLLSTSGGNPQPLMGVAAADVPLGWSADGRFVFVRTGEDIAANVSRVEVANGTRTPWKTLIPSDPAGITGVRNVRIRADGRSYAYSYNRLLSELYLVDGLR
jgi:Tol biopolymer transport system component